MSSLRERDSPPEETTPGSRSPSRSICYSDISSLPESAASTPLPDPGVFLGPRDISFQTTIRNSSNRHIPALHQDSSSHSFLREQASHSRSNSSSRSRSRSRSRSHSRSQSHSRSRYGSKLNGPGIQNDLPLMEDESEDEPEDLPPLLPVFDHLRGHVQAGATSPVSSRRRQIEEDIDQDAEELNVQDNSVGLFDRVSLDTTNDTVANRPVLSDNNTSISSTSSNNDIATQMEAGDIENAPHNENENEIQKESTHSTTKTQLGRNFLSKFLNLKGTMIGPSINTDKSPPKDEESQVGQDIQLSDLDANQLKHVTTYLVDKHYDHSKKQTENKDHALAINSYLTEGLNDLDDMAGRKVGKTKNIHQGVLSHLLRLYENPINQSNHSLSTDSEDSEEEQETRGRGRSRKRKNHLKISSPFRHSSSRSKSRRLEMGNLRHSSGEEFPKHFKSHFRSLSEPRILKSKHAIPGVLFGKDNSRSASKEAKNEFKKLPKFSSTRPKVKKKGPSLLKKKQVETRAQITVHIATILQRQRFILLLCKAFMLFGAPTHRLEEFMTVTAKVLETDAQFLYLPGCMTVAFGDVLTRTSEMQLVRSVQGLNLGKLDEVYEVYKNVIHDVMSVPEAISAIEKLLNGKDYYPRPVVVLTYAMACAMVCPFAFRGKGFDILVSFGVGGLVAMLQYYIVPLSNVYSTVFEVSATIVVSFVARALGSIDESKVCYSAVVQGSIAMILPGYTILCGSLELQSKNIVSGAVRVFYAIIYSLFLGFGITLGAALYGWIDHSATNVTRCATSLSPWYLFIFVPAFAATMAISNQAKFSQLPAMTLIGSIGYVATYFAGLRFKDATEIAASIGSFVVGILANVYSRLGRGMAVSAMLPGIFLQVPGGIAAQSSLISGIEIANELTNSSSAHTSSSYSIDTSFGFAMVRVVIGITVGLFAAIIVVYPFGKKNTTIFSL
ncbi:BA75_01825T0 [Komagataella pastoris]|uniref:BA75_01825T0 n=1 Tax=Komagataella pastoris TaxID=4922 RepID=A0A1B2J9A9_PICPA|nr:BA75_01825T0 [Komagataella pastoris]